MLQSLTAPPFSLLAITENKQPVRAYAIAYLAQVQSIVAVTTDHGATIRLITRPFDRFLAARFTVLLFRHVSNLPKRAPDAAFMLTLAAANAQS